MALSSQTYSNKERDAPTREVIGDYQSPAEEDVDGAVGRQIAANWFETVPSKVRCRRLVLIEHTVSRVCTHKLLGSARMVYGSRFELGSRGGHEVQTSAFSKHTV